MLPVYILWGISLLIACNISVRIKKMTKASDRVAASLGDLEATAADAVTALAAAAPGANDAAFNQIADRVDAVTTSLNTALAPPAA